MSRLNKFPFPPFPSSQAEKSSQISIRFAQRSRQVFRHGFGLIELMIALAISSFLIVGLLVVFIGTNQTYATQASLAQLSDKQRFSMTLLAAVLQSAGYYTGPTTRTISAALPAESPFAAGQVISGTSSTISVRFQTTGGDGIMNCLGGVNTSAVGTTHYYRNVFSIDSNNNLQCTLYVDGSTSGTVQKLIDSVTGMSILYGIDTINSAGVTPKYTSTTQYVAYSSVTDWNKVNTAKITLSFANPIANQTGGNSTVSFTQIIRIL